MAKEKWQKDKTLNRKLKIQSATSPLIHLRKGQS